MSRKEFALNKWININSTDCENEGSMSHYVCCIKNCLDFYFRGRLKKYVYVAENPDE